MRRQALTFTVAEIVAQGYQIQHAEQFVALLAMTPPASERKARPGKPKAAPARPERAAPSGRAGAKSRAGGAVRERGASPARSSKAATAAPDPAEVRAWAAGKGIKVGVTGRIPGHVLEQFLTDAPQAVANVNGDRARRMLTPR